VSTGLHQLTFKQQKTQHLPKLLIRGRTYLFVWKVTLPSAVFKMIPNLNTAPRKQTTKHYHDDISHSNLQFVKIYDLTNDNLIQHIVGKAFILAPLMILHPSPASSWRTRHPSPRFPKPKRLPSPHSHCSSSVRMPLPHWPSKSHTALQEVTA